VYVVADSVEQAAEDLRRDWKVERLLTWATDHSPPRSRHLAAPRRDVDAALRGAGSWQSAMPSWLPSPPIRPPPSGAAERELDRLRRERADLETVGPLRQSLDLYVPVLDPCPILDLPQWQSRRPGPPMPDQKATQD
jgi:hypothetical protein